ncbi:MAG: SHOCT domain-containing protein [Chloroflexota bacterium]
MGRFLIMLGVLLDLAVVALLVLTLNGFGLAEAITGVLLEPFVCESTETLWMRDGSAICIDSDYQERDVTGEAMPYLLGGTVMGVVIGIVLINAGARMTMQNREKVKFATIPSGQIEDLTEIYRQGQQVDFQSVQATIPPEVATILRNVLSQMGIAVDGGTLSERLQQLEDARRQGLITQAEYEQVRQAILDRMDD